MSLIYETKSYFLSPRRPAGLSQLRVQLLRRAEFEVHRFCEGWSRNWKWQDMVDATSEEHPTNSCQHELKPEP